jgi:glycosyltransferase involved in cell wall biosynthesis
MVYEAALGFVEQYLQHIRSLICIMRIGPSDQMLNALLSKAKIVLQLSTREGFEVKVSEALHMGKPVIATLAGGIPLQVQHGKNGFLVDVGDTEAVAGHLLELWMDQELYASMSSYAANSVSDEVSTVGNMLSWLYLASKLSKGVTIRPNERWINDMAREEANEPYSPEENRLKRVLTTNEAK